MFSMFCIPLPLKIDICYFFIICATHFQKRDYRLITLIWYHAKRNRNWKYFDKDLPKYTFYYDINIVAMDDRLKNYFWNSCSVRVRVRNSAHVPSVGYL